MSVCLFLVENARSQDHRQPMLRQTFHPRVWWGQDDGLAPQMVEPLGSFVSFDRLRTSCFLPVCNLVLWHFPSPSSLAGFEARLCSSEGPHLSAPRWLLLLADLHQLHCYQSGKITGPLRSNREQDLIVNQGMAKVCPSRACCIHSGELCMDWLGAVSPADLPPARGAQTQIRKELRWLPGCRHSGLVV